MWYKKALDLNDLNKEFALEKENAVEDYDEQAMKEDVEDLFQKVRSGEEYTSPSGAIKLLPPRIEPPFTDEEVDGKFDSESNDSYDVYESIKEFPSTITKMKNTAEIISRYIDSGVLQEFYRKIDSLSPMLEKIIQSAYENVELIEKSFNNPELSRKFNIEGYPRVSESEVLLANRITLEITKIINELYNFIRNDDAKQEWLNAMAKRGVAANFLSPEDKTRYKKTMNRTWGLD
jgi:hypothetical protein